MIDTTYLISITDLNNTISIIEDISRILVNFTVYLYISNSNLTLDLLTNFNYKLTKQHNAINGDIAQ